MKILSTILFTSVFLYACDQSSQDITELEGTWEGICITSGFSNSSTKIIITYQSNNIRTVVNSYSDQSCSMLTETTPLSETQLVSPENLADTFDIGNTITTSNGVTAKELNEYNTNNELIPNIYSVQNGSTLYLGLKCYPSGTGPSLTCITSRPTELDYVNYYTKQN